MIKTDEVAKPVKKTRADKWQPFALSFIFFVFCPLLAYFQETDLMSAWNEMGRTLFVLYFLAWAFNWDF